MGLRWIDAVLVVAYLVAILAIGLRFAHRQTTTETYFVAKRSIPAWALGLSMLATIISAVTFIAYPGAGYAGDWSLLVPGVMVVVVPAMVGFVVIPFYRQAVNILASASDIQRVCTHLSPLRWGRCPKWLLWFTCWR